MTSAQVIQRDTRVTIPAKVEGKCDSICLHAITRFKERIKPCGTNEAAIARIQRRLKAAKEVFLKPKFRLNALITHLEHARYYMAEEVVFVVENNVLKTCYIDRHKGRFTHQ